MSILDVKDRIPTEVLENGAVRYGVYDESGKLLRYEYMKREDEPIEEGTPINRALFRNLQGDLYTQDRYNEIDVYFRESEKIDLNKWQKIGTSLTGVINKVKKVNGKLIAINSSGVVYVSDDSVNWTQKASFGNTLYDITYGNGKYLITGSKAIIYVSEDLEEWTQTTLIESTTMHFGFAEFINNKFIIGIYGKVYFSEDCIDWTEIIISNSNASNSLAYNGETYIIGQNGGYITFSKNLVDWESMQLLTFAIRSIVWSEEKNLFVAIGDDGGIAISRNGLAWEEISTGITNGMKQVIYSQDRFIAIGYNGAILVSEDGEKWSKKDVEFSYNYMYSIVLDEAHQQYIYFGSAGSSSDLIIAYEKEIESFSNLDLPLTSYENTKKLNIKVRNRIPDGEYAEYTKQTTDIIPKTWGESVAGLGIKGTYLKPNGERANVYIRSCAGETGVGSSLLGAVDGSTSTHFTAENTVAQQYIELYFEEPVKINKMKIAITTQNTSYWKNHTIQGSFDGVNWYGLLGISSGSTSLVEFDFTSSAQDFQYYRIYRSDQTSATGTNYNMRVYEWQVSEWESKEMKPKYIENFDEVYLNINNLGEKKINTPLNYNQNYELVYNGESWDISQAKFVTGTYTTVNSATSEGFEVDVGFTPDLVLIYQGGYNNSRDIANGDDATAYKNFVPAVLTKAYSNNTVDSFHLTNTGFHVPGGVANKTVHYIAIKF